MKASDYSGYSDAADMPDHPAIKSTSQARPVQKTNDAFLDALASGDLLAGDALDNVDDEGDIK